MSDEDRQLATRKPSWVKEFVDRAKGEIAAVPTPHALAPYTAATGGVLAGYSEAALAGGLLGTARAMFGDDVADKAAGAAAGLAAIVSIATAGTHPSLSEHIRNTGIGCAAIFTDHRASAFIGGKRDGGGGGGTAAASPAHGEVEEDVDDGVDPVVKAAERLGRK